MRPIGVVDLGKNVDPSAAELIRQDLSSTLYELFVTFETASYLCRPSRPRPVEHAPRMWADVHLEQLGWALVLAVVLLVFTIASILR